jgi:hypothetical protein
MFPKNKICLKGTKISGHERMTQSYTTTGVPKMFPTVAASLELLKVVL